MTPERKIQKGKQEEEANEANTSRQEEVVAMDSPAAEADPKTTMACAAVRLARVCGQLKWRKRTGWVHSGVHLPESVSDHMHRMTLLALLAPTTTPICRPTRVIPTPLASPSPLLAVCVCVCVCVLLTLCEIPAHRRSHPGSTYGERCL
jgi:HD domain